MLSFDVATARLMAEAGANLANRANRSAAISTISRLAPGARLDRFAELAAIHEIENGADRATARKAAAAALGFESPDQLFAAACWRWREALLQGRRSPGGASAQGPVEDGLAALDAGWVLRALSLGWDELGLWHCARGLAAQLRGAAIIALDADAATLADRRRVLRPLIDAAREGADTWVDAPPDRRAAA